MKISNPNEISCQKNLNYFMFYNNLNKFPFDADRIFINFSLEKYLSHFV
jgi:hypothetical protein